MVVHPLGTVCVCVLYLLLYKKVTGVCVICLGDFVCILQQVVCLPPRCNSPAVLTLLRPVFHSVDVGRVWTAGCVRD